MHVTFVTTSYPSGDNPRANIFTHRAIKVLSSEIEAEVIEFSSWKQGRRPFLSTREYDGVRVLSFACPRIPAKKASHINALIQAHFGKYLLKSHLKNTDVIHATALYPSGFVASQWAGKVRKPCTAHAIGSDVNFLLPKIVDSFLFHFPWHLDGIVCESEDIMRKVTSLLPGFQNAPTIYRGVDTDKFAPMDSKPNDKKDNSYLRFLFLGGFHTWDSNCQYYNIKGGHIMLQAWQRIETQITPDILIIGGPRVDLYRTELENWRMSLSRPDAISFLSAVDPDVVSSVIHESDVVVIPSLFEGLPNIAKEAQACGRPVLGTDAGGIPETVLHEKTGLIVSRGNVDGLSSGFLWFHENRSAIGAMGMSARRYMLQKFTWERFSEKMMDFFNTAIQVHVTHM